MKTYYQLKAALQITRDRNFLYLGDWRYNPFQKYAESMKTGEIFRSDFDVFIIEKGFIDYQNCDE